jgi:hypothetical protein
MRYIVKKTEDGLFEFTHIEIRQTIDEKDIEIIKGKNKVDYAKMVETFEQLKEDQKATKELLLEKNIKERIKNFKEEVKINLEVIDNQLSVLEEMIKEADKVK